MSKLDKAKIIAEIAELGAKAYSLVKERRREDRDMEDLKKQLAEATNE
ncbi:hypothetical protein LCGC14_0319740 [marine sediment metagenome]|uniref:Uncharacterized protein n=1 Tax=marine sediment metagenome TaxID=412755 RepID=A0A0F9W6T0_9ZZZZ